MKAIILGAGIGGLATAIALKGKGYDVKIFEQADRNRPIGAGLWLAPNALAVLEKLGLRRDILAKGIEISEVKIIDSKGKRISGINGKILRDKFGFTNLALSRSELQDFLIANALPEEIQYGKRLVSIDDNGKSATAYFSDGSSYSAPFVIAADGINSTVRKIIFPRSRFRSSEQTSWRFILKKTIKAFDPSIAVEVWGDAKGLRFGYSSISQDSIYCYATVHRDLATNVKPGDIKSFLLEMCRHFPDPVVELIAGAHPDRIIQDDLMDLQHKGKWHRGNTVFIGDSIHATTPNMGQGASQAIEDAYALGESLEKFVDHRDAFEHYHLLRAGKAKAVRNMSFHLSQISNLSGFQKNIWKCLLNRTPEWITMKSMNRLYATDYLDQPKT